jgi:hypothetical protein
VAALGVLITIQTRTATAGLALRPRPTLPVRRKSKTQRMLGHAKGETTEIYLREELQVNRELARLRAEKRKP